MSKKDLILEAFETCASIREVAEKTKSSKSYVRTLANLIKFSHKRRPRQKENPLYEKISRHLRFSKKTYTCKEIAALFGCSETYVYQVANNCGVPFEPKSKKIISCYKANFTIAEVVSLFNVSERYAMRLYNQVKKSKREVQAEKRVEALKLYKSGMPLKIIAETLNMGLTTVKTVVATSKLG